MAEGVLEHPRFGPGTVRFLGEAEDVEAQSLDPPGVVGVTFTSDNPTAGVVWGEELRTGGFTYGGASDDLGHIFVGVSAGGSGGWPIVFVPTENGFDDLGSTAWGNNPPAPFGGSRTVPFEDVDGDGVFEIVNVSNDCATETCEEFAWYRTVWAWNGNTFAVASENEPIPAPEGW